jgi:hypothetical protein
VSSLRARVGRAERRAASLSGSDLERHWDRVFAHRALLFDRFLADVPAALRGRVREALGTPESVADWLFAPGPAWPGDAHAVAAVAWMRTCWDIPGDDHPALDGCRGPLPAALVELLLDHPGAEVTGAAHCPGCAALVPSVPAHGEVGVHFVWADPLVGACPLCGGPACPNTRAARPGGGDDRGPDGPVGRGGAWGCSAVGRRVGPAGDVRLSGEGRS